MEAVETMNDGTSELAWRSEPPTFLTLVFGLKSKHACVYQAVERTLCTLWLVLC